MLKRQLRVVGPDVGTALKVAFATTDMKSVNQHFGSSQSFAVYTVDPDGSQLLEVAQFGKPAPLGAQDGTNSAGSNLDAFRAPEEGQPRMAAGLNEDKLVAKIAMLAGCSAVYSQACGASAVRQLMAKGIQPVRVEPDTRISALIAALQQEMRAGPSAWLAKAINQQQGADMGRFDAMEDEGWSE